MGIFKEIPPHKLLLKTNIQTHKQKNNKSNPTTCSIVRSRPDSTIYSQGNLSLVVSIPLLIVVYPPEVQRTLL